MSRHTRDAAIALESLAVGTIVRGWDLLGARRRRRSQLTPRTMLVAEALDAGAEQAAAAAVADGLLRETPGPVTPAMLKALQREARQSAALAARFAQPR